MTGERPHIQLKNAEVAYNEYVSGLRRVNLSVAKGEFVFLCGQTGSGKSTIIKVLSCQVRLTGGEAFVAGKNLAEVTEDEVPLFRRGIGIVPQDFGLLPNKKVWENVAYPMRAVGRSRKEVRAIVPVILEQVNINHRNNAYPHELSGGEQQRVAIARALINDPAILLADEPTGNLDPAHSEEIIEILRSLNERGTTVIVATHDMAVVEKIGTRVVRMSAGRIEADDQPSAEPVPEQEETPEEPANRNDEEPVQEETSTP